LIKHADAGPGRVLRPVNGGDGPLDSDFTAIRDDRSGDDFAKRALAGPIGTDQHVNFTALHVKFGAFQSNDGTEVLVDAFDFENTHNYLK